MQAILLKQVPFHLIVRLILHATSWTFSYIIPISTLFSVIITVGDLNQKSEITAMRAVGINFFHLMKPYFYLGTLLTLLLYFHQQEIVSQSYKEMGKIIFRIYNYHFNAFILPETFTRLDSTDNQYRIIYVGKKVLHKNRSILKNVQIKTIRQMKDGAKVIQLIIAKEAEKIKKISQNGEEMLILRLLGGNIFIQNQNKNKFEIINFNNGSFDLHLNMSKQQNNFMKKKNIVTELDSKELLQKYESLKNKGSAYKVYVTYLTEYHKRIALSVSVFLFIMLGFIVSIVNQRTGKGFGLGLSIIFIFVYYIFYFSIDILVLKYSFMPPFIFVWLGNLSLVSMIFYFFRKRLIISF